MSQLLHQSELHKITNHYDKSAFLLYAKKQNNNNNNNNRNKTYTYHKMDKSLAKGPPTIPNQQTDQVTFLEPKF